MNSDYLSSIDPTNASSSAKVAYTLMEEGNLQEAEKIVGWALDFSPDSSALLRCFSDIAKRQGKIARALAWSERAIEAQPGEARNYEHRATLHSANGELPAAEQSLMRAVELEPDNAGFLRGMSDLARRRGNTAQAFIWSDRAIDAKPDDIWNYDFRAHLHAANGDLVAAQRAM